MSARPGIMWRGLASSGNIIATGIARPRELVTTSGNITVRFAPESAVRITATTSSGAIRVNDLALTGRSATSRSLTGTLGAGTGTLAIGTSSRNIIVSAAR